MKFWRHDLIFARWNKENLSYILEDDFREMINESIIPGIVRRNESNEFAGTNFYTRNETVYVGFVYPHKIDGNRIRYASSIAGKDITQKITPYTLPNELYEQRTLSLKVLHSIAKEFDVGVWGSNALEIATGLHYTDETSDLDLIVKDYNTKSLFGLWKHVRQMEKYKKIRIDVEITLPNGYDINLKEYVTASDTLVAKGLREVILLKRSTVEELL
ncbi:MAG: phosphoribosyl-dephospho-CoA transferase MdcG domain-containing protein [Candidatus Methanofastidiosia archaeon]